MMSRTSEAQGWRTPPIGPIGRAAWVALCLGLASVAPLAAQQGATIGGVVVSSTTNQPLAGAAVQVVGTTRGTVTNQEGRFLLPGLQGTQFTLSVSMIGFRTVTVEARAGQTDLRVALNESDRPSVRSARRSPRSTRRRWWRRRRSTRSPS